MKRHCAEAGFTRLAWVSAKQRFFSTQGQLSSQEDPHRWATLVRSIADQLGFEMGYSQSEWLNDFRRSIRELPGWEKCLIVIDNLETVDDANVIEFFDPKPSALERVIKPHKVVVTTRNSVRIHSGNVLEETLIGLSSNGAYKLIRYFGRTSSEIIEASNERLKPILTITEGNPLLIKLIIRRYLISRKPLDEVLEELKPELKEYLYVQSLRALERSVGSDPANQIMNAFCPVLPGETISYEQLQHYSGIEDEALFDEALRIACDLALIRVTQSFDRKYSIHSLLWEFTCR